MLQLRSQVFELPYLKQRSCNSETILATLRSIFATLDGLQFYEEPEHKSAAVLTARLEIVRHACEPVFRSAAPDVCPQMLEEAVFLADHQAIWWLLFNTIVSKLSPIQMCNMSKYPNMSRLIRELEI